MKTILIIYLSISLFACSIEPVDKSKEVDFNKPVLIGETPEGCKIYRLYELTFKNIVICPQGYTPAISEH